MKVLVDNEVSGRLGAVRESVELRDAEGRVYGYFHPVTRPIIVNDPSLKSPFSKEELARRAAEPGGRPLAEIWKDLGRK
jgi:hypothetical protein